MDILSSDKPRKLCCLLLTLLLGAIALMGCADRKEPTQETPESSEQSSQMTNAQVPTYKTVDLNREFYNIKGCAVHFDPQENAYSFYQEPLCKREYSPDSTFKIASALIGLRNGVVEKETSTLGYDGTQYPVLAWNADLTLQEAFRSSCIWYFRKIIDAVGESEVKKELEGLSYGNCDVSEWEGNQTNPLPSLNGFWIHASLKISPLEQVQVLATIFEGQSDDSDQTIAVLKNIMQMEDDGTRQVYGKTGSGPNGEAWFVGFSEIQEKRAYYAVYLNDPAQKELVSGDIAKQIALEVMQANALPL